MMHNFDAIIPLPTCQNNDTFYPDIDATHATNIVISKHGDKYTTLSDKEMHKCTREPPSRPLIG